MQDEPKSDERARPRPLYDVLPTPPAADSSHGPIADAKLTGELHEADPLCAPFTQSPYALVGHLGERPTFATRLPTTNNGVAHVVGLRSDDQMARPDACRVVACVSHKQTKRNTPIFDGPCEPRSLHAASAPTRFVGDVEAAVSTSESSSGPFPAGVALSDLAPETGDCAFIAQSAFDSLISQHDGPPSAVVFGPTRAPRSRRST